MTQKEKIRELKSTIQFLYEKEGRSKSYISKLLNVDRRTLGHQIEDWELQKANIHYLTPSNQKFVNKNKQLIKSRLDKDVPLTVIAKELGVSIDYLRYIIERTELLNEAKKASIKRREKKSQDRINSLTKKSSMDYDFKPIDGELWKEILGYDGYFISNMGRVKKYSKRYKMDYLLKPQHNESTKRLYIAIKDKNLQVSRLVGFAFVDGYSEDKNTIDHKDNNPLNNKYDNLEWVSQSENNKLAYSRGRSTNKAYSKSGKFKKIILDKKYEFKTITALAKFLGLSVAQTYRQIDGETNTNHEFKFIY